MKQQKTQKRSWFFILSTVLFGFSLGFSLMACGAAGTMAQPNINNSAKISASQQDDSKTVGPTTKASPAVSQQKVEQLEQQQTVSPSSQHTPNEDQSQTSIPVQTKIGTQYQTHLSSQTPKIAKTKLFLVQSHNEVQAQLPAQAAGEIQSLAAVVKYALQQNPEILRSAAQTGASRAAIYEAKSGFLPRANASFSVGREGYNASGSDISMPNDITLNPTTSAVVITQPLFSGLSTYNLLQQRREENKAATFDENYSREDLALRAVYAHMNVTRLQKIHDLAVKNIANHTEILTKIRKKVEGGAGQQADLDLAIARLAQRKAALYSIEGTQAVATENFIKTIGLMPQKLIMPTIFPRLPPTQQAAQDMALSNNPSLFAAQAELNAATRAVSVAKSNFSPRVNLEVSAQNSNNMSGYAGNNKDVRGMVVVNYNLFNGGGDLATVDKASQYRMVALYNYRDMRNRIIENVSRAWDNFQADELSLTALQQHARSSADVLTGYKLQFELGRNSLLNVLDMENEVFDANVRLVNGEYAIITDRYEVLAAMGKLVASFL